VSEYKKQRKAVSRVEDVGKMMVTEILKHKLRIRIKHVFVMRVMQNSETSVE